MTFYLFNLAINCYSKLNLARCWDTVQCTIKMYRLELSCCKGTVQLHLEDYNSVYVSLCCGMIFFILMSAVFAS